LSRLGPSNSVHPSGQIWRPAPSNRRSGCIADSNHMALSEGAYGRPKVAASNTVIEVALNGPWTRQLQPSIPLSPEEIISDAVECAKAGAALVHFHQYDHVTGKQTTDYAVVSRIMDGIRSRTDVIVYPAIRYMSNAEAIEE